MFLNLHNFIDFSNLGTILEQQNLAALDRLNFKEWVLLRHLKRSNKAIKLNFNHIYHNSTPFQIFQIKIVSKLERCSYSCHGSIHCMS